MQVATPPTASEFRGGIIGVTLRPVSGADIVSLTTDEHLLHTSVSKKHSFASEKSLESRVCDFEARIQEIDNADLVDLDLP